MNPDEWRRGGKFFDYKNFQVFYRVSENAGEILLCLHGFPSSSYDYHKIQNALAEKFKVLTFDLIGYGFSAKPANFDYTTFNQTDVLQALVENLKIRRVHILSHDYGNTITLELLARAAENRLNFKIETICFLNGALFPETHRPILAQKILTSPLGFLFAELFSERRFKKDLASVFGAKTQPSEKELNEFLEIFKYNGGHKIIHKLIGYMVERRKYRARWTVALQKIDVPFRFIDGLADPVSGAHLVRRFRQSVPHQKDIVELEGVGHFPHFEAAETILNLFFEFHEKI